LAGRLVEAGTHVISTLSTLLIISQDALPKVDASVQEVRKHLFTQYEEVRDAQRALGAELGTLKLDHASVFQERLSALLWATVGAYTKIAAARGRTIYEAEARHDWDAVLYRFYAPPGDCVSSDVM
jgi:hypothetical protein